VYLPNKGCGTAQGVVVSENNGMNWSIRTVPGSTSAGSDPSVGVGRGDQTGGIGRVYFGYADGDTKRLSRHRPTKASPGRSLSMSERSSALITLSSPRWSRAMITALRSPS